MKGGYDWASFWNQIWGKNRKILFWKVNMNFEVIWWLRILWSFIWLFFTEFFKDFLTYENQDLRPSYQKLWYLIPQFRYFAPITCAWYVISKIYFTWKKEITSRMSAVVGFVVKVVFVKKIAIFDFQIPGFWLHHPFDPNMGPSKFPSSCSISMPLSSSDPRCWWSMHINIGYFHPKYNFDISHKNSSY